MRLRHGEHNEELCAHLMGDVPGRFSDWALTAAFYACVHFVEHALFPMKTEGGTFPRFDDYHRHRLKKRSVSKHGLKAEMAERMIPGIGKRYKRLMDACMNARYTDYGLSEEDARAAQRAMQEIKKACLALKGS